MYESKFLGGDIEQIAANVIADNLLAQVGKQGRCHLMLEEIVSHRVLPDADPKSNGTYITKTDTKRKVQSTRDGKYMSLRRIVLPVEYPSKTLRTLIQFN